MNEHPGVGRKAPGFSLFDTERRIRTLDELLDNKLVIAFFPGAFTSVCTKEMCTLRDSITGLEALGSSVVGISVNDPFTNAAFAERNAINFPLLSDYKRVVAKAYGVDLLDFAGMKGYTAAKRSIFVVDRDGIIRYKWVTEDQSIEPDYNELDGALAGIE
ncbi:MAG: redoxin domain-containing protein [Thermoplasmata archaeon]